MQNAPLLIRDLLFHGQRVHGDSSVITVEEGGSRKASFVEVAARAATSSAARWARAEASATGSSPRPRTACSW